MTIKMKNKLNVTNKSGGQKGCEQRQDMSGGGKEEQVNRTSENNKIM